MPRSNTPKSVETDLLLMSRRRCALCFGLHRDQAPKAGQIAHVDRDASNSTVDNLAWLCLAHHDEYDTRRSQSKGFTPHELVRYRGELYAFIDAQHANVEPSRVALRLSPEAASLAEMFNRRSTNGYKFDPQIRIGALPVALNLSNNDVEIAVDELRSAGLLDLSGSQDVVFATNRLFWETDPIFGENDPTADAEAIARVLDSQGKAGIGMADLAAVLGWAPRRLNPAVSYLVELGHAGGLQALGSAPYWYIQVSRTTATKRLVRDLNREG